MNPTFTSSHSRSELAVKRAVEWIQTHRDQFWAIFGITIAAIVLVFFMINRRQKQNDEAWVQLGAVQGQLMQPDKMEESTKALEDWFKRFQGTSATGYAKFMQADALYRKKDFAGSAAIYEGLSKTASPKDLRPLALSALSAAQEMGGKLPEAQATAQQFLDRYPDHFLAASMQFAVARLADLSGNTANASALYDRFIVLYPQSPWTNSAKARLQTLSPASASPVKK
jgi:TolA-binding protein